VVGGRLSAAGETGAHIQTQGIGKRYGGVVALADIDVTVRRGEAHALCGENGAGKSTLGKIIAGSVQPDAGRVVVDGRPVRYRSPQDAIRDGIVIIAQELALVPQLSVLDNVFLGQEHVRAGLLDRRRALARYRDLAERIGLEIDPSTKLGELRTAEQQQVEIVRALARDAQLIVMDEPTASLGRRDVDRLHATIRQLTAQGVTIIYVSHFLTDLLAVCDTVTVLKDGRFVRSAPTAGETVDTLVTSMLGRELGHQFPEPALPPPDAPVVLSVRDLRRAGAFADVSFDIRAGEIVGMAGLVGSGRTEIARAIFGADRAEGHIEVDGVSVGRRGPAASVRRGLAMLPESRKDQGLVMMRSIRENVGLVHLGAVTTAGFVRRARERSVVGDVLRRVDTRAASTSLPVSALSGGNQQKVAFAKWMLRRPRVLLADEPTRGVDVGAKRAIYELIHELAREGVGVLVISSEVEELLGLAHRTLVVRGGRIVRELSRAEASEESIMRAAFGTSTIDQAGEEAGHDR
jgi:ABC-type sugar transport system ATPase subunit